MSRYMLQTTTASGMPSVLYSAAEAGDFSEGIALRNRGGKGRVDPLNCICSYCIIVGRIDQGVTFLWCDYLNNH